MRCLSADRLPFQYQPAWRATGLSLLFALAAVALPGGASATTADAICASTDDPCRVTTTIVVDPGSMIDVGPRQLEIVNHGALSVATGTMTLQAGALTVDAGGSLLARGDMNNDGGTINGTAGVINVNGGIDASGSNGGSVTLTASTTFNLGANVTISTDASAATGDAGDITLTASGAVTLAGVLSAVGRNSANPDDVAGDGGTISVEGSSITLSSSAARIIANSGSPDGTGGEIDLLSDSGDIETAGQLAANGLGSDGDGGMIDIVAAAAAATIAGTLSATGGSTGGGEIDVSGTDLTITSGASLSVSAISSGGGGVLDLEGDRTATISGSLVADGGNGAGASGGSIDVSACTVLIDTSGSLSGQRSGGTNTLTGYDRTIVQGTLRADASGQNIIRFAGPDYAPVISAGAHVTPAAVLTTDASIVPCNPVGTPTPTPTVAASSPTATVAAGSPTTTATPANTPTPRTGPCIGDCHAAGMVSIADLVTGVDIALGTQPIGNCPAFDADNSGTVSVNELIQGVNNALIGCP